MSGSAGKIARAEGPFVFLNHPYDGSYRDLFEALLFTTLYCNTFPRHAREVEDASVGRLEKIAPLIDCAKYSVHDLSSDRFNMPFELGMFVGCKRFGDDRHSGKVALVVDCDQDRLQKIISDLAGCDSECHRNNPAEMIRIVRNFLAGQSGSALPSHQHVVDSYERFRSSRPQLLAFLSLADGDLPYCDHFNLISLWSLFDDERPVRVWQQATASLPPMQ